MIYSIDNIELIEADSSLKAAPSDTFKTTFRIKISEAAEVVDDEIYLPPFLYNRREKNIFASENREFPIEYGYVGETLEINTFVIPEGWTFVEKPEGRSALLRVKVADCPLSPQYARAME